MDDAKIKADLEKGTLESEKLPGKSRCCGFGGGTQKEKSKVEVVKEPSVSFFSLFRFADKWETFLIILGALMGCANGVTMPLFAIIFGGLIDDFNPPGGFGPNSTSDSAKDVAAEYALLFCYLAIGTFVASACQVGCFTVAAEGQTIRIRQAYLSAVLKQEISWFDEQRSGELSAKVAENTVVIKDGIGEKLGTLFQFFSMFFSGFIIGFYYNWLLTLVICACAPLLVIGGAIMMKILTEAQSGGLNAYSRAGAIADETIQTIRTVVAFGAEDKLAKNYEKELAVAENFGIHKAKSQGLGMGFTMGVYFLCYAIAFWYGAVLITNDSEEAAKNYPSSICETGSITPCGIIFNNAGDMCSACPACNCGCLANLTMLENSGIEKPTCTQGGDIPLVFFAVVMGAFALGQAAPSVTALTNAKISAAKIYATIDRQPAVNTDDEVGKKPTIEGHIEFTDVSFAYPTRKEIKVLDKLNLAIEKGKTVALVGGSGCGKSTVVSLLQRFYDVDNGTVKVDGTEIGDINVKYLRSNIGLVSQEPVLFATSIARNIAYGAADGQAVSMEDIVQAAKAANAYNFITEFPNGFDTQVGQKGSQLSGGQKQRIAIARAILRNAPVLILDEATSALDNESERIVQAALDNLISNHQRTTIVIAHRLSTIRKADKIVVLGEGKVLEQGSHDELMGLENGHYNMFVTAANKSQENGAESDVDNIDVIIDRLSSSNAREGYNSSNRLSLLQAKQVEGDKDDKDADDEDIYKVPLSRLFTFSKQEAWYYVPAVIGAALNGAQMPVFAILFTKILSVFFIPIGQEMLEEAAKYAFMFVGLGVVAFIANFLQFWGFGYIGEKMTRRIRSSLFRSILRQEISYFDDPKNSTGALTSRLSTDAALVKASLTDRLGLLVMNIVTLVVGLGIAFANGWKLSLVLLVCFPVIVVAGVLQMVAMTGFTRQDDEAMAAAGQILSESISGIRTVTAFGTRGKVIDLYTENLAVPKKLGVRKGLVGGIGFGVSNAVIFLVYALAFYYGGILIDKGEYTFEQMFLVFFAVVMTAFGAGQAASMAPDIGKAGVAVSNVFKVVDRKSAIDYTDPEGMKGTETSAAAFNFENVKFAYPQRPDVNVFESLSFELEGGNTIAFVGSSGSGKSTVIALLERFYDVANGRIQFDDIHDLSRANVNWLRNQIGLVEQEPNLFSTTIKENIAYGMCGDTVATDEEIVAAAMAANAHNFISEFPNGYDTLCGESGAQLSGGQKQRICIARAIIRKPRVLLLDEATAALDNESERIVQEALDKLVENKAMTTVVVAHRLTTIQNADKIIVLDHGVVVEQGKHNELLERKGAYSKLWHAQLGQKE